MRVGFLSDCECEHERHFLDTPRFANHFLKNHLFVTILSNILYVATRHTAHRHALRRRTLFRPSHLDRPAALVSFFDTGRKDLCLLVFVERSMQEQSFNVQRINGHTG
jgi:hypothetical protein